MSEEANKKIVVESYHLALNKRDVDAATKSLGAKYIQHNPLVADGIDGWTAMVNYMKTTFPDGTVDIKRVLTDGDFVVLNVHSVPTPGERAVGGSGWMGRSVVGADRVAARRVRPASANVGAVSAVRAAATP